MHLTPKQRRILANLDDIRSLTKKGNGTRYKFLLGDEDCSLQVASLAARGLIRRLQSGRLCRAATRLYPATSSGLFARGGNALYRSR